MLKNVGKIDRTIRIVLGIVIIFAGILLQSWWGLIGLLPLLTGVMNFCGLYKLLGISTNKQ